MISDEVRELISAYVDGELPHPAAARLEESAKQDPNLQRAIRSYRRLGDTLRDWDAEASERPSSGFKATALARIRAYESERGHEDGGPVSIWWQRPAAMAAGVLIALGLGLAAANVGGKDQALNLMAAEGPSVVSDTVEPFADFRADFGGSASIHSAGSSVGASDWAWPEDAFRDVIRQETRGFPIELDGELVFVRNRRTLDALVYIKNLERGWNSASGGGLDRSRRVEETRTGTRPNVMLASMLKGYEARRTEFEGLVALQHESKSGAALPADVLAGRPAPARLAKEASRVQVGILEDDLHYLRVRDSKPVLTLAGELWVEPMGDARGDQYGRARIVTGTTWVRTSGLVPMAWANDAGASANAETFALRSESIVLGPKARRALLHGGSGAAGLRASGLRGRDADLLTFIAAEYGKDGVVAASRLAARNSRMRIERMVTALSADEKATGFAVFRDNGELLGTEIFGSHALLVQFAPRLLRGYMLEAGGRVKLAPANGRTAAQLANVREYLGEHVPRVAQTIVDVRTAKDEEEWPKGMRQVNLLSPTRKVIGHGLLVGDRPVHLTLFAD
jgi:hypothetical protein